MKNKKKTKKKVIEINEKKNNIILRKTKNRNMTRKTKNKNKSGKQLVSKDIDRSRTDRWR